LTFLVQAERAFHLWASGSLSIKNLPAGNRSKTIKMIDPATGKDAGKEASFSEDNWGSQTRTYLLSVRKLREDSFPRIVVRAQALAKIGRRAGDFTMSGPSVDLDALDERAQLVDN
jgi:hypothetical protein